jgi:copper transport protein
VEAKARIDDLAARVTVDPAKTGSNVVSVFLERQGQPVSADEVSVTATAPADVGPFRLQTRPAEPGHYIAPPLEAPVAGVWSFEIAVRRGEFNLKAATVSIPIKNAR